MDETKSVSQLLVALGRHTKVAHLCQAFRTVRPKDSEKLLLPASCVLAGASKKKGFKKPGLGKGLGKQAVTQVFRS